MAQWGRQGRSTQAHDWIMTEAKLGSLLHPCCSLAFIMLAVRLHEARCRLARLAAIEVAYACREAILYVRSATCLPIHEQASFQLDC